MAASGEVGLDLARRVLPDEGAACNSVSDGLLHRAVQSRFQAQSQVRKAISRACAAARKLACADAIGIITAAVRMDIENSRVRGGCPNRRAGLRPAPMTALLVHLTAAAASGDRADTFDYVCCAAQHALEDKEEEGGFQNDATQQACERGAAGRLCVLRAAYHGAVPLAVAALEECWAESSKKQTIVVAFEDADRFPEDALRDIVHVCSTAHKDATRNLRIMLIFGLSISAEPLNSALGASESSAIAPVTVHMPSAEACFHVIVDHVFASKAFPIILSQPVFSLLRRHFLENTSSVSMLEQILADICSMHFFDQPLAALNASEVLFPDYLTDGDDTYLESEDRNERYELHRKAFYEAMDTQMARDFISAKSMPSVSKYLPEAMIQAAEDVLQYQISEIARSKSMKQQDEEIRSIVDTTAISDLAYEWHSRLCEWRWVGFLVRNVLWDITQAVNITEAELRDAICGDDVDTPYQYCVLHMKTLLFEELLPDGAPSEFSHEESSVNLDRSNHPGQPFIRLIRRKFNGLDMAQLRHVVSMWIRSLESLRNFRLAGPASVALLNFESDLNLFYQSLASDEVEGLPGPEREVHVTPMHEAQALKPSKPMENDNGQVEPLRKKRKGTVDSAMEGLESGGIGRGIRRAKGSLAAREKRFRDLKAVAPESSLKRSLGLAQARVKSLFVHMLSVLKPLQSLPMHETILFSNAEQLCAFSTGIGNSAEPRDSFLCAMRKFRDELGDIPAAQAPSIAQAYEILAEGGRMINLSEWYHAFDAVRLCAHARTSSGPADQTEDARGANPEAANGETLPFELTTQAQFARAVAELEFLGILKHTNRKTDHVLRLLYE
jgi:hypothetical protein